MEAGAEMAPRRPDPRVTFERSATVSSTTSVRKRKKPSSGDQTSGKRPRRQSPEEKDGCPLQAEVIQHIERCINTALWSVLSRKKGKAFEPVENHLSYLQRRLLQVCKDLRVPASKLGNLKNLARDVQEEQRKVEVLEDTVEALNREIEEAVETADQITESIMNLEGKLKTLKQQATDSSQFSDPMSSNKDTLHLPPSTFEAPIMQDQAKKLENPSLILKEVCRVRSDPIYKNMLGLLETSYAEISNL
ncbi:centromere protein Q isoform X3 [Engystomops pustulosus]|uniref:centromere protein Q isoform X3 n=1 Tax=Engystomops pustulosus TaxID=76066 RepID=UPI003AFA7AAF